MQTYATDFLFDLRSGNMSAIVALSLILSLYFAASTCKFDSGTFQASTQFNVLFDTVLIISERNILQCVAECFRNMKCNAFVENYGSNTICSLLIVENDEDNTMINQTLIHLDPDSVIWIRQDLPKTGNNTKQAVEGELSMVATTDDDEAATTATAAATATAAIAQTVTTVKTLNCPNIFTVTISGCYYVGYTAIVMWLEALQYCQSVTSELADPDTQQVQT